MKKSQLDRAIEILEAERHVLDLAIAKLQAQRQPAKPARVRTTRKADKPLMQEVG